MTEKKVSELLTNFYRNSETKKLKTLKDNAALIISADERDSCIHQECRFFVEFLKYGTPIGEPYLTPNSAAIMSDYINEAVRYNPSVIRSTALLTCERFTIAEVTFPNEMLEDYETLSFLLKERIYSNQFIKIKDKKCLELVRNTLIDNEIYYPLFKNIDVEKFFYRNFPKDCNRFKPNKRLFGLMDYVFETFGVDAVLFACDCMKSYKIMGQKLLKSAEIRDYLVLIGDEFKLPKSSILIKEKQEVSLIRDNPDNINILPYSSITEEVLTAYLEEAKIGMHINYSLNKHLHKNYRSFYDKIHIAIYEVNIHDNKECYNIYNYHHDSIISLLSCNPGKSKYLYWKYDGNEDKKYKDFMLHQLRTNNEDYSIEKVNKYL